MSIWDDIGIGGGEEAAPIRRPVGANYADDNGRPVYGGRYNDVGPDGITYLPGTSAADQDEAWYREMARRRNQAPQIDRTQSDQSRDLSLADRNLGFEGRRMQLGSLDTLGNAANGGTADQRYLGAAAGGTSDDALGARRAALGETEDMRLLGTAARGDAPSKAEILGQQMSDRALRGQVSAAGNVRGGPGASASAYRYASQNAATQRADMNAGIQAGRADELAQARGAYSGALGAARRDYGELMSGARRDYGTLAGSARNAYQTGTRDLRTGDDALRDADIRTRQQDIGLATDQAKLEAGQRLADDANERYYVGLDNQTKFGVLANQTGSEDAWQKQRMDQRMLTNAEAAADWNKTKDVVGLAGAVGSGGMNAAMSYRQDQRDQGRYDQDYSDVNAKEPVQWGSLAPITWGVPAKAGAKESEPDDSPKADPNDVRDTIGAYDKNAGIYREDPYGSGDVYAGDPSDRASDIFRGDPYAKGGRQVMYSDKEAKDAAFVAGVAAAQKAAPKAAHPSPVPSAYVGSKQETPPSVGTWAQAMPAVPMKRVVSGAKTADVYDGNITRETRVGPDGKPLMVVHVPPDTDPMTEVSTGRRFEQPALSDERTKRDFGQVPDADMASAARSMSPSPYAYKPQYAGKSGQAPGEVNVGPMANAMAKDPVASTAIVKDPQSGLLAIDQSKGLKLTMGSLASLQHQIDDLRRRNGRPAQP